MRFARHALAIAALLAVAAFAWPRIAYWQQSRLADRLAVEVLAGDPSRCKSAIDQLARLDLAAIEPLVFLAACGTPQIASTAQGALLDFATAWEIDFQSHGDAAEYAERLAVLAEALVLHSGRFDAEAWPWQQRLARRIIANCEAAPASRSLAILRSCDRALATARPAASTADAVAAREPIASSTMLPTELEPPPLVAAEPPAEAPTPPAAPESLNALRSSSGSLPLAVATSTGDPKSPERRAVVGRAATGSWYTHQSPLPNPPHQGEGTGKSADAPSTADQPLVVEVPSPAETEALLRSLRRQPDRALLDKLSAASRFEAAVVRQALERRGYSTTLLDAITRLQRAAVDERRHALEHIDALPSTDAQRVLRWFVDDPEPTLRLRALAILATSGDPRLAEIARRRAIQDADPRVAALATRLMNETK